MGTIIIGSGVVCDDSINEQNTKQPRTIRKKRNSKKALTQSHTKQGEGKEKADRGRITAKTVVTYKSWSRPSVGDSFLFPTPNLWDTKFSSGCRSL